MTTAIVPKLIPALPYQIRWEKLPDQFVLDDDPVDNLNQPPIAATLTESLELAGRLSNTTLTPTNYAICATVNDQIVVKAPDWCFVSAIRVSREEVKRSYTPQLQGELPTIVMEFLSDTEGSEYSSKPTYPPGKWFFYEQILKVPFYAIFEPESGILELYQLDETGQYQIQPPDQHQHYWIAAMNLFLGVWQGTRADRTGNWLRWWSEDRSLLPWGSELSEQERQRAEQANLRVEQERQRAEQAQQQAEQERQRAEQAQQQAEQAQQRAERLAAQLRAAGIEPDGSL